MTSKYSGMGRRMTNEKMSSARTSRNPVATGEIARENAMITPIGSARNAWITLDRRSSVRRVNRTQKFQVSALTLPAVEVAKSVMLRSAANRAASVAREIRNVNVYVEAVRGGTGFSATSRDSPKTRKK